MSFPDDYNPIPAVPPFDLDAHQRRCMGARLWEAIEAMRSIYPEAVRRYGRLDETTLELRKALDVAGRARHMMLARNQKGDV